MNRVPNGSAERWKMAWGLVRSGASSFGEHWALAGFSLITAFGIWFVVQDVENPLLQTLVPRDPEPPSVRVGISNNSNDFIIDEPRPVQLKVEGRKGDIAGLHPDDFKAEVDVLGLPPGEYKDLPVKIVQKPAGVRVVEVKPSTVSVSIHAAQTREVRVTVRETALPSGYTKSDEPVIDPVSVKVRGIPELVDSVATVDVDANLAGVRGDSFSFEGDLVAHTAGGNAVTVQLLPARAKVTYKIQQDFVSRTLGFASPIAGVPAAGYRVANITYDPPVVTVTGKKSVVDSLPPLGLEQLNVGGAKADIVLTRQVEKIQNVIIDRQTVIVRIEIRPVDCDQTTGPCSGFTFFVPPEFGKPPPGLAVDGVYQVAVRITGPLALLNELKPGVIKASVSLTGGTVGTGIYPVKVTVLPGLTAEADPLTVTLKLLGPP